MKLNLGKQIVTVENRNLNSVVNQCIEQKVKEKIVEVAKKMYFELDNKTVSEICYKVKEAYNLDTIMRVYEDMISSLLNDKQY